MRRYGLAAILLLAVAVGTGCALSVAEGHFDRTLEVGETTVLDVVAPAGSIEVHSGDPGRVHVAADFTLRPLFWQDATHLARELENHPPIEQEGNLVRIGQLRPPLPASLAGLRVNYRIEAPPRSELRVRTGAGTVQVVGLAGPVRATTGSGDIELNGIAGDTELTTGSGDIQGRDLGGSVELRTGHGDVRLERVGATVRATTGSGDITVADAHGTISIRTGHGDVRLERPAGDVRVRTGAGDVTVRGAPGEGAYWEIRTGAGDVLLELPATASCTLRATTHAGDIVSQLPLAEEERDRHRLRGRLGSGSARIEIETGVGDIRLHRAGQAH
jgi:hypothetical protein